MEWFTLVSTALGVVLGVGATNFNERVKWKRERSKAKYDVRSKLYADYLADLTKTRDEIRLAARGTYTTDQQRREALERAFVVANIYARRYQIRITASPEVADAADVAHRALRAVRDEILYGEYHSVAYEEKNTAYANSIGKLIAAMEQDVKELP